MEMTYINEKTHGMADRNSDKHSRRTNSRYIDVNERTLIPLTALIKKSWKTGD